MQEWHCRSLAPAALKYARRAFKKGVGRVTPEPAGKLADRLFTLQRLQRDLGFEFWMMLRPFRHS